MRKKMKNFESHVLQIRKIREALKCRNFHRQLVNP
uniref:Uncharacterized protein n=1 Tax=Ralstonia solanacearum TaxID=305 RepID=A0A0S4WQT8_RALSL|nr:protein of unknown function [Ralstonia solanacearum]